MFTISESAANFYKKELPLDTGEGIRLFVQYGGIGQGGFSLGIMKDLPEQTDIVQEVEDVHFFTKKDETWFTDTIQIDYNSLTQEAYYKRK